MESQAVDGTTRNWKINFILGIAAILQLARIVQVQSTTGEVPFLSANDRSRWCTIAALTINGTYEIDDVVQIRDPKTKRRTWYTIDMVRHRGLDGKQHFYSSKPPLLPSIYAAVYYAVSSLTGASLMNDPFFVVPVVLIIVNLLPLLGLWWLMTRWVAHAPSSEWTAMVATTLVGFGTFLSTFANTLNNHLPAAMAVGLSLWCIDRIALRGDQRLRWFALCGLATSFSAANELPALSWLAAASCVLLVVNTQRTLLAYVPALLPVGLAFFATNYIAHGELLPAYAHRGLGAKILEIEIPASQQPEQLSPASLAAELRAAGYEISDSPSIQAARRAGVWELWDAASEQRFGLQRSVESADRLAIHVWGDWYDYPESYWVSDRKQGVDKGEPDRGIYIFHSLLGHHGIFSLTPFWLVSLFGALCIWRGRETWNILCDYRLLIAAAIVATSLVTIGFYLARPMEDRNYGGVCSGFRWAFWLIPAWFWLALAGLQCMSSAWARRMTECLLAASIFSASYAWENPWTSPWLMQYWDYLGWL